jgi:hypothetical protein
VSLTAAVVAAAAEDNVDGLQWRRRGGVFNGGGSVRWRRQWEVRIGDGKATMENDISGGGWQWWASEFDDGGPGQ